MGGDTIAVCRERRAAGIREFGVRKHLGRHQHQQSDKLRGPQNGILVPCVAHSGNAEVSSENMKPFSGLIILDSLQGLR